MGFTMIVKNKREKVIEIRDDRVFVDGADYTDRFPKRFYPVTGSLEKKSFNRVVCEAAHGKPKDGEGNTVIHIDGDKNNIRPSNLKWGKHEASDKFNRESKKRCLSKDQVLEIVDMLKNPKNSQYQISLKFNISQMTVSFINRGLSYQDITGIDPNREYPKDSRVRLMPNGKYATNYRGARMAFNCISDAIRYLDAR